MAIQCSVAIATYLDHLRIERGLSINSVESYKRDLGKFSLLLDEKKLDFALLSEPDISSLVGTLTASGLAPTSINRFLSSLKGFYKYCSLEYQIVNPMADVTQFKIARKLPKALSVEEVSLLIDSTSNPA
jgi:integrase/recombinase XerD